MTQQEELDRLLNQTKTNLFFKKKSGFIAGIMTRMDFIWTTENCPTAQTNGLKLWWNPDCFLGLDKETRTTMLAHELWHPGFMHPIRAKGKCPDTYNIAADHVINLMLEEHGYYMDGFPWYRDPKFRGWNTEEVYEYLLKEGGKPMENPLSRDIVYCDEKDEQTKERIISNGVSAKHTAHITNKAGDVPGETELVIDSFLNPKLPWNTILLNHFNELYELEYSYKRPNRRYQDPLLPGLSGSTGLDHIIFAIDVSGSITNQEIMRANSEVKYIKDTFNPEKLTIILFDTKIQKEIIFEQDDDFNKIEITGRGGTNLNPVMEYAKKVRSNAVIILSDLQVNIPEKNPGFPLIWICVNNASRQVPYGKLIHLTE